MALLFIVQYHCRMSLLSLRYKMRAVSRAENNRQARNAWNKLCQALTTHKALNAARRTAQKDPANAQFTGALQAVKRRLEHEQFTGALQAVKKGLEHERLHGALETAKRRLEQIIFTEEAPTQPIDLSALDKFKTAWHSFETGRIPRVDAEKLKGATGRIPRIDPEQLKTAWHSLETGKAAAITREMLAVARRPSRAVRQRKMTFIALGSITLLLILLFSLVGLNIPAIRTIGLSAAPRLVSSELNPLQQQAPFINASKSLVRISQLDPGEYASQDEFNTWGYSACSTASMTEVFNAYGRHYRITDVLKVESAIGEITPQLGLTENIGIANTAAKFGFQTSWGDNWSLDQVLNFANAGRPVIVGWPPSRYEGGHIVVVLGGDANNVYLADSSLWDRQAISRAQFMQWWAGFAAVVTPE